MGSSPTLEAGLGVNREGANLRVPLRFPNPPGSPGSGNRTVFRGSCSLEAESRFRRPRTHSRNPMNVRSDDRRIMVVDDDPATREILDEKLTHAGYRVTTVADAEAALQQLTSVDPNLVISDIRLPGIDGLSLLRRLRENVEDVDVVVITGHEDMSTAIEAMKTGAFDYVVKPVGLDSWRGS